MALFKVAIAPSASPALNSSDACSIARLLGSTGVAAWMGATAHCHRTAMIVRKMCGRANDFNRALQAEQNDTLTIRWVGSEINARQEDRGAGR